MADKKERGSFKGSLGFVLAAAGSAVGLGNIWRFPYLAARDGGGIFLLVYIILALTFGFTLLTTEVAIGRKTKQSPLTAYKHLSKKWQWIGVLSCLVPFLILPYYCAIGGWVIKYLVAFSTGHAAEAAQDGYFTDFIVSVDEPGLYMVIFLGICCVIIYRGVSAGIEKSSKFLMPILLVLVIGIAVYSLTIKSTNDAGKVVTGLQGLKVYLIPDFTGVGLKEFFNIFIDALGQLFFSLSVAMGILIAYGSYVPDEANLSKSTWSHSHICFHASGLPVNILGVGILFFAMVLFAAITSAMSILEAIVSSFIDAFGMSRHKATLIETALALAIGQMVCFGYNHLYFEYKLPNGSTAQILDILDYITNNFFMPIIAIATCILIGWVLKPKTVIDEATKNGEKFGRKTLYVVMIKVIAPLGLLLLLLKTTGILK